jgi:hypothetical protein
MQSRALFLTALTFALSVACTQSEDDACGKGTVYRDGACHPAPAASAGSSGSAPTSSEGGAAGDAGGASPGETIDPNFGLDCAVDADCTGVTDYCVPKSPFDMAYCSVKDCDVSDPATCPASWTCTDLSRFVEGLPSACTRPTN